MAYKNYDMLSLQQKVNEIDNKCEKDYVDEKVNDINSSLEEKAKQIDLDTANARIDALSSLSEGSTTGDAELIDGRTAVDGTVYTNIGGAIRGQINTLIDAGFVYTTEETYKDISPTLINSGNCVSSDNIGGVVAIVSDSNKTFVQLNNVAEGEKYKIYCSYYKDTTDVAYIFAHVENGQNYVDEWYFDENATTQKTNYLVVTVPAGATRLFVNGRGITPTIQKIVSNNMNLVLKSYSKDETYTRTEINNLVSPNKVPVIVFNFDETALDDRYKILQDYGFTATFADGDETMTKTLVKNGFDICPYLGSHTLDYSLDTTKETLKTSITTKMQKLESWGIYNPVMCLCSGHRWGTALEEALKETGYYNKFHYIRASVTGNTASDITAYTPTKTLPGDLLQYPYAIEAFPSLSKVQQNITKAIEDGNPLIMLMMHKFTEDGGSAVSKELFTQIVQHVKTLADAGTVKVMNMRQYYAYYYAEQAKEDDRTRIFSAIMDKANITT